ncbi:uncharacterized protein [Asterias amurensis]|uniref:uncharacterized protein isoform X2 n=1 Tax=Asterias amurensis TaxID=7602 RepID=UPI003AB80A55
MSSESDGGESPKGWTVLDGHGRTEDSDDSSGSGSSSDFVDLGEDRVQYHHTSRSSSAINVVPSESVRPSAASSLPANFRAHVGGASQVENLKADACLNAEGITSSLYTTMPFQFTSALDETENNPSAPRGQIPDLETLVSSCSTLVGSESPALLSSTGDLNSSGNHLEQAGDEQIEVAQQSVIMSDGEIDAATEVIQDEEGPSSLASDTISVDSIEVISLPLIGGDQLMKAETLMKFGWLGDETREKDKADSELVSQSADPLYNDQSPVSSPSEESDSSEFERIEVDMIPPLSEIVNHAIHNAEDDEENKMDVAGARPISQMNVEQPITSLSSPRPIDKPQNYNEDHSVSQDETYNLIPDQQSPPPPSPRLGLNISSPAPVRVLNIWPLDGPLVPIQPFHLPAEVHTNSSFGAWPPDQPLNLPPDRFDLPRPSRRHSNGLSDDGFELIRRPRRLDDDAVSTVSSSSSDVSGFVNVRQRNAPSLSRSVSHHHSDFDDENLSNFTDGSEDSLPANMMIPSRKSGVRQYKHSRDEGFNATLDWLVFMVLITGLALGIGHFIGSSQEMAYQHSMNTGQVQRLRELQDDLVTCLDHSTGPNNKIAITAESSSPALQAIRLMESLNSRILADKDPEQQLLLEQEVGQEQDTIRQGEPGDGTLHLTQTERRRPSEEKSEEGLILSFLGEVGTGKDVVMDPESSVDLHTSLSDDNRQLIEPSNEKEQILLEVAKEDADNLVVGLQSEKGFNDDQEGLIEDPVISLVSGQLDDGRDEEKDTQNMTNRDVLQVLKKSTEVSIMHEQDLSVDKVVVGSHRLERGLEEEKTDAAEVSIMHEQDLSVDKVVVGSHRLERGLEEEKTDAAEVEIENDLQGKDELEEDETNAAEVEMEIDLHGKGELEEDVKSASENDISPELSSTEYESATIKALKQKMEQMEERMDKVLQTAEHWQQMIEDLKKDGSSRDDEGQDTSQSSESSDKVNDNHPDDQTETPEDPLAGIAAAFERMLPGFLHSEHEIDFLAYLNQTEASVKSFFVSEDQNKSGSWSEAFYTKLEALKAFPESDEVQKVLNNTKLFAEHLSTEIESVTESLKNRSARLVEEHNITVEGLGERANGAWTKLKNITSDVLDYNKKVLSGVGERLTDTLHTVENISAETIAKHNISLTNVGKMAEQVWGSVKNYSSRVTDGILNATTTGKSESEPSKEKSGFGQTVKDAWSTVKNYSNDFTKKQNLSISGLRDQVKAAWGKVKNTSAQVLEDISDSNLAGKFKEGAKKLGEKVETTFRSVKDKVKRFHKKKVRHGKKQHSQERSKHHRHENHFRKTSRNAKRDFPKERHSHGSGKSHRHQHQHRERHHRHRERHHLDIEETTASFDDDHEQYEGEYSVPVQQHHQKPERDNDPIEASHPDQGDGFRFSSPQGPQWVLPSHGKTKSQKKKILKVKTTSQIRLTEKHQSVPSRKQSMKSGDSIDQKQKDKTRQEVPRDDPRQPFNIKDFPQFDCKGKKIIEPKWEDLFDCMDMHCKGDEKCMQSQRKDAARLYSELLDYQDWLKDRHLKKDVRELKDFLEELGEFLSETDTDDEDLDELKDEFGEMVQDMEERALKRQRKSHKKSQDKKLRNVKLTIDDDNSVGSETTGNSTIVIDLDSLPQQKESQTDPSSKSSPEMERRKYAGRGYQSTDDQEDWYLQRAKDREDQRKPHESNPSKEDNFNWYLHWVQGRIDGRTGVTVWDMYEWIKERYVLREELRRHEMEDHTNWFLRRP